VDTLRGPLGEVLRHGRVDGAGRGQPRGGSPTGESPQPSTASSACISSRSASRGTAGTISPRMARWPRGRPRHRGSGPRRGPGAGDGGGGGGGAEVHRLLHGVRGADAPPSGCCGRPGGGGRPVGGAAGGRAPGPARGAGEGAEAPAEDEGERGRVAVRPEQAHHLLHGRAAGRFPGAGEGPGPLRSGRGSS
jgi:hypothetical protein